MLMKVKWSNGNLQVVTGDEIEVLRGIGEPRNGQITATKIHNKTRGTVSTSSIEGAARIRMPHDFKPPIHGYAKNIELQRNAISFDLEKKAPPIVSGILREYAKFIDQKLYERCKDKDYHDVVTNAFPILEDRIRAKIDADPSYSGKKLIDYAFNPNTGKLTLGETKSEREAFYFIFRGAIGFLRNPPSHRFIEDESNVESFEIICMVDLLLRIMNKAKLRPLARKIPTRDRRLKVAPRLPKELPGAAIEIVRIRREHSKKIKDGALKPWQTNIEHYCKIDVAYSKDVDKMVGVEPKDPTDLEYFDVAKSHLKSKYPDVLNAWEKLKRVTSKHNKELAFLMEKIRTFTIKKLKISYHYSNIRGRAPEEYITLDRFVENISEEMELRLRGNEKWAIGEPKKESFRRGDEKFYQLAWGSYTLVTSRDEKDVERAIILINKIIETPRFIEKVKNLIKREDEIYKVKFENFETKIKDVIKSIELGMILEGKCRFCP